MDKTKIKFAALGILIAGALGAAVAQDALKERKPNKPNLPEQKIYTAYKGEEPLKSFSAKEEAVAYAKERGKNAFVKDEKGNWEWSPAPKEKTLQLSFSVLSDIHVQADSPDSAKRFENAIEDLSSFAPGLDALVINGDIGQGREADYDLLKSVEIRHPLSLNALHNIGNHAFYKAWYNAAGAWSPKTFPNGETEEASIARYLRFAGLQNIYYDKWINGFHFIFIGGEHYRQWNLSLGEDAWLSEGQLKWLSEKLAESESPDKPAFVFIHQPIPNTTAGSERANMQRAIVQSKELEAIMQKHPQAILFTSHTHALLGGPKDEFYDGFHIFNTSNVVQDEQGLVVGVYGDRTEVVGRSFKSRDWIQGTRRAVRR